MHRGPAEHEPCRCAGNCRISQLVREGAAREAAYPEITIGVATAPEDGDQAASLLEAADARLYMQKKHRRTTGPASAASPTTE
ncbi:diguanylate cyclase [Dyella ginsengisoli]|uniref:Diguanylate cyclase n=1 Tax=Dyella ginsengisoli TaxID=363848 RepID=A0ABW8JVU3_9GAMM